MLTNLNLIGKSDAQNYQVYNRIPNRQVDRRDIKFRPLCMIVLRTPDIYSGISTGKKEIEGDKAKFI